MNKKQPPAVKERKTFKLNKLKENQTKVTVGDCETTTAGTIALLTHFANIQTQVKAEK